MNEAVSHGGIVLAYIGDAVLEILIRERLVSLGMTDTGEMSRVAQSLICAPAQSARMEKLFPLLTEDEEAVYRLGRNHHTNSKPKKATAAEYHRATGMEAVFGYLHFSGETERIHELFEAAYGDIYENLLNRI